MKKVYILLLTFMAVGLNAHAQTVDQTFQFQKEDGTVVGDGETIWLDKVTESDQGWPQIETGLFIKNTSNEAQCGQVELDLTNMPNGSLMCCCFGNCSSLNDAQIGYSPRGIMSAGQRDPFATEWILEEGSYAEWTGTAQFQVYDITTEQFGPKPGNNLIATGEKITLHFIYAPAGISDAGADRNVTVVARYSTNGQLLTAPVKGVNIVKYSNGKTVKQIIK